MIEFYDRAYTHKLVKAKLENSGLPMLLMASKIDKAIDAYYDDGFRIVKIDKGDEKTTAWIDKNAGKKIDPFGGK